MVGTEGYALQPQNTVLGVQQQMVKVTIDEKLLKEIAAGNRWQIFQVQRIMMNLQNLQ